MGDEKLPRHISLRTMLRRIGAGAAIAWSAPVLTSLKVPAFAQGVSPACVGCEANPCGDEPPNFCGTAPNGDACVCALPAPGQPCECVQPACGFEACAGPGDCPPGFICGFAGCCDQPACVALCGTVLDGAAGSGGPWGQ